VFRFDAPLQYDLADRSHIARGAILSRNAEAQGLEGTLYHQQPLLVVGRRTSFLITRWHASWAFAVPKTVLLPQKDYIQGIVSESLRNLEFPLDWQAIVDYVGFPAFMKPFDGGGWKNVSKVNSIEELIAEYDKTGTCA